MMLISQLLIMAGAGIVLWRSYNSLVEYQTKTQQLEHKESIVSEVAGHTNQIFFRSRGYYAFLNKDEYEQIFVEYDRLKDALKAYKQLPLTKEEQELIRSIELFTTDFIHNVLPSAVKYAQNEDYASLRKLSSSGVNDAVNEMIDYAAKFKVDTKNKLIEENDRLLKELYREGTWFILFVLCSLFIFLWITNRAAKDVGTPLHKLSAESEQFATGKAVELHYTERQDEIGQLSRSLKSMMVQIMSKEEELVAQNEELVAQQDELQASQDELQDALRKMEESERYLERRNRFILSLANSSDKQHLLISIIRNIVEVLYMDKGIIVLLNPSRQHAAFGISENGANQLIEQLEDSIFVRVMDTKKPYLLHRDSLPSEKGYETTTSTVDELYLPILDAHDTIIACIVVTRIGRTISSRDELEAMGLAKQISLSLEKVDLFEETERQRQMTQDMLDTIQEGVQLLSLDGTTLQVNRKLCELLDIQNESQSLQMDLSSYMQLLSSIVTDPKPLIASIEDIVANRESEADSWTYHLREPLNRYIRMYCEPLYRHQKRIGTLLVHRDITKEYEIDRVKSEFVSTVSHELRTPLASVLGFTELLLHKDLKPERQHKYLSTIHQEAKRLTALINDFLDLQRMESGRQVYEVESVNMVSLLNDAITVGQAASAAHRIFLTDETTVSIVQDDCNKLMQVFSNLLSNAVKYSPRGGDIEVRCFNDSENIYIDVKDEGLGIPEESIQSLFTRFYRVDNSDRREIGGTGLGLAIVKEILNVHNGQIEVQSVYGQGSTFRVQLPLAEVQHRVENHIAIHPPAESQSIGTVVVVENDKSWSELLTETLQDHNYRVVTYVDDRSAFDSLPALKPDAVVIDLVLDHGADGWRMIKRIRDDSTLNHLPIVVCSAFEEKKKAYEYGADVYLVKPFQPLMIVDAIREAIRFRSVALITE
ncbi:ATP-binding protein [Paenibacillus marinisediminis]